MLNKVSLLKSLSCKRLSFSGKNDLKRWASSLELFRKRNAVVDRKAETDEETVTEEEEGDEAIREDKLPIDQLDEAKIDRHSMMAESDGRIDEEEPDSSISIDQLDGSSLSMDLSTITDRITPHHHNKKDIGGEFSTSSNSSSIMLTDRSQFYLTSSTSNNGVSDPENNKVTTIMTSGASDVFYAMGEADLMVMDNLVRDVRNFRDALNRLSCVLNTAAVITKRGVFGQGASSVVADVVPYNEQCVRVHQCLGDVLKELKTLMFHYNFLHCSDVLAPARCLTDAIKALKLDEDEDEVSSSVEIGGGGGKHGMVSVRSSPQVGAMGEQAGDQDFVNRTRRRSIDDLERINAAQSAVEKLQVAVAESVGDYLTWEMAQYESSLTKLSQSSEELSNSATSVNQNSRQIGHSSNNQNGQQQVDSNHSHETNSTTNVQPPMMNVVQQQHTNGGGGSISSGTSNNGNATPGSNTAASSTSSTPHLYQQRITNNAARTPGSIQRRHSAFQTGVKSPQDAPSNEQTDRILERLDNGVELAFARAKSWSKYCKEILNFVHRRINLESEHARAVQKLAESTQAAIENEHFLPLQNVYLTSFKVEHEFFDNCMDTMKRLYEYKYIKPLEARKAEQDRKRKELKAQWERCNKQVQDAALELKKSKQNFVARENNYKKARESSVKLELSSPDKSKIDKRRKMEEDAMLRRQQAAEDVRALEARLEEKYEELEKMKVKVLDDIRELIYQCDQTTKACTSAYFQALAGLWSPLPAQYQSLSESCRAYIPGMEYAQYIKQLPHNPESTRTHGRASSDDLLPSIAINGHVMFAEKSSFLETIHKTSLNLGLSPPPGPQSSSSFIDSGDEAGSVNSYYDMAAASMIASAASTAKAAKSTTNTTANKLVRRPSTLSEAALTHRLQKVRLPTKCCHCDSYTFFQTVQCTECCMTWHKQCLTSLEVACDVAKKMVSSAIQRRMSTRIFGAPLPPDGQVPIVLRNCVSELEKRGCTVKGLYRVCGVKSKIEELCEQFERDNVDLSEVHPTNVASVAKLYLRQLPEPILTLKLYPQFVALAKEFPAESTSAEQNQAIVSQLRNLVQQLPKANHDTLKYLVLHLHRLTWFESENQMSAGNLGIVFGPTLLRRDEGGSSQASLNSLLEAPLQTRAIELLVEHAYDVFDVNTAEDMERMGVTEKKAADSKDNARRRLSRPPVLSPGNESNGSVSPRSALDDDEMMAPRRASTTPDLLKGSRPVHERSLSIAASSSSEFTPDSPDDSPERETSASATEWRSLLASAASHEQRLHQALTTAVRREKSAPIGRNRRATSPGDLSPSPIVPTDHQPPSIRSNNETGDIKKQRPTTAPVLAEQQFPTIPATPVSTPIVPECGTSIGSPFQRAKGIIVRRVSSHANNNNNNRKGLLVTRSTSNNSQGGDEDPDDGHQHHQHFTFDDPNLADIDGDDCDIGNGGSDFVLNQRPNVPNVEWRPHKPSMALKRGSAPVLEKRMSYNNRTSAGDTSLNNDGQQEAKRKSQSVTAAPGSSPIESSKESNDRRPSSSALHQDDLSYV